jgi:hypothetical protein
LQNIHLPALLSDALLSKQALKLINTSRILKELSSLLWTMFLENQADQQLDSKSNDALLAI